MSCLTCGNLFGYALWSTPILYTFIEWDSFSTCQQPIQIFLILCYGLFILGLSCNIATGEHGTQCTYKFFDPIRKFLLQPAYLVANYLGISWQVENSTDSPNCVQLEIASILIDFTLGSLSLVSLILIISYVCQIISRIKRRQMIERVTSLRQRRESENALMAPEEELDGEDLRGAMLLLLLQALIREQEPQEEKPEGFSLEEIEELPKKTHTPSIWSTVKMADTCPVCYDNFAFKEELIELPICEHAFHQECIRNWLVKHPVCPMCRADVRENMYKTKSIASIHDRSKNRNTMRVNSKDIEVNENPIAARLDRNTL